MVISIRVNAVFVPLLLLIRLTSHSNLHCQTILRLRALIPYFLISGGLNVQRGRRSQSHRDPACPVLEATELQLNRTRQRSGLLWSQDFLKTLYCQVMYSHNQGQRRALQ